MFREVLLVKNGIVGCPSLRNDLLLLRDIATVLGNQILRLLPYGCRFLQIPVCIFEGMTCQELLPLRLLQVVIRLLGGSVDPLGFKCIQGGKLSGVFARRLSNPFAGR